MSGNRVVVEYNGKEFRCYAPSHLLPAVLKVITPYLEKAISDSRIDNRIEVTIEEQVLNKVGNDKDTVIKILKKVIESASLKERSKAEGDYIHKTISSNFKDKVRNVGVHKTYDGCQEFTTIYIVPSNSWGESDEERIKKVFPECRVEVVDEMPKPEL